MKTNANRSTNNNKENSIFFNFMLQLICNLFKYKSSNSSNFSYKKKVTNAYIIQIDQRYIIDSGASNYIT